jgi:hypothetical protein
MNCAGGSFLSTTAVTALKPSSWLRPKYLLFAAIGLMLVYAGACSLLLGPMQFSDRLRQRFRKLHRAVGRIYVTGVFVAAPLGAYIQFFQERMGDPRSFSIAAAVDATLWMTTTAIAMLCGRTGFS